MKVMDVLKRLFRFFSSLKLAVVVLLGLATSLAVATFIESLYDTRTAQFWVYKAWWFEGLLTLLGLNILCVALSRLPWKPRHTPFLLAHLGILTLLTGSWLTQKYGLDGSIRVSEGETTSVVELEDMGLIVIDNSSVVRVPIKWIPPEVGFKKIPLKERGISYDITVDRYITHADAQYNFIPDTNTSMSSMQASPAVKVKLVGGRMAIQQEYWLWGGDPSFSNIQAGPSTLIFGKGTGPQGHPSLVVTPNAKSDGVHFVATSSEGKKVTGDLPASKLAGYTLDPGWHGGVVISFEQWIPHALPQSTYSPSRIQGGQMAPPSAIHLISGKGGEGYEMWLGMGERAVMDVGGKQVELGYFPERVILPFQVKLDRFRVDHYDGTRDPSSYSSVVTVIDRDTSSESTISMNEPLHHMGTTLYQASYEDAMPRPITSIFSVNRDPGRPWKYLGSILIVLGSILLFAMKYVQKKRAPAPTGAAAAEGVTT